MRVACVQMCAGVVPADNLKALQDLVRQAHAQGADCVSTPEGSNLLDRDITRLRANLRPMDQDVVVQAASGWAQDLNIWLHLGSVMVQGADGRAANRSLVFSPSGQLAAQYDKVHLFDVDLDGGESYRESATYAPGDRLATVDTPWGRLGLSICYDVRFAQQYWRLAHAGALAHFVPAAFTVPTGQAHWHVLTRARAIETGSFVIAAAQGGHHQDGRRTFGHSLIIGPWGEVLAEKPDDQPGVITADIDMTAVHAARRKVPNLQHERPTTGPGDTGLRS